MRKSLIALGAGALLLLGACSSSLSQSDVEEEAANALEQQVGVRPIVECPGDLDAEVGAEMECELSVEGDDERYPVYLTVSEVDGNDVNFDIEVGEEPLG